MIPLGVLNSLGAMVVTPGTDEEAADAGKLPIVRMDFFLVRKFNEVVCMEKIIFGNGFPSILSRTAWFSSSWNKTMNNRQFSLNSTLYSVHR